MRRLKTRSPHRSHVEAQRPATPILAVPLICALGGLWLAESLAWRGYCAGLEAQVDADMLDAWRALALAGLFAMGAASIVYLRRAKTDSRAVVIALCLAAFALGLANGALYWRSWSYGVSALSAGGGGPRAYVICGDPVEGRYSATSLACVSDGRRNVYVRVSWPAEVDPAPMGTIVKAYGRLSSPAADDAGRWYHRSGYVGSVMLRGIEQLGWREGPLGCICCAREQMRERMSETDGEGVAILAGVVLGDRTRLSGAAVEHDFRLCGLAHLIAVSGTHLSIVAGLALWVLSRTRASNTTRFAATVVPAAAYAVLTGLAPSAVRALVMLSFALAAGLFGRRRDAASALSMAALLMLCLHPSNAFSLGFGLSVSAVMGLVLLGPLVAAWVQAALPRSAAVLAAPLALTLAAQFATLPLSAPAFSIVPVVSPLANLLCAPLVSAMICLGVPSACIALIPALSGPAVVCLHAAAAMGNLTADIAHVLAALPMAAIPFSGDASVLGVLALIAAGVIWAWWPLPTRRRAQSAAIGATIALLVLFVPIPTGPQVVMLDVGQGDAVLVRDGTATLLIDTGPERSGLLEQLALTHVRHLDAVLITHLHDDHYGGLSELQGVVDVGVVVFARGVSELCQSSGEEGIAAREVVRDAQRVADQVVFVNPGDAMQVGRFSLTVVSPDAFVEQGGNADSIVLTASCDADSDGRIDATALFTGDAESDVTGRLLASGAIGSVDLLKVGHHGSKTSVSDGVAPALAPKIALISCGAGNRYGHPHPQCVSELESVSARILRTDRDGRICVSIAAGGLTVRCDSSDGLLDAA